MCHSVTKIGTLEVRFWLFDEKVDNEKDLRDNQKMVFDKLSWILKKALKVEY